MNRQFPARPLLKHRPKRVAAADPLDPVRPKKKADASKSSSESKQSEESKAETESGAEDPLKSVVDEVQIRLVRMGLTGLTRVKARPKNAKLISGQGIDEGMYSWSDRSMITEWNASRTGCEAQVTETVERMARGNLKGFPLPVKTLKPKLKVRPIV
jgi:hypothetical protein